MTNNVIISRSVDHDNLRELFRITTYSSVFSEKVFVINQIRLDKISGVLYIMFSRCKVRTRYCCTVHGRRLILCILKSFSYLFLKLNNRNNKKV